MRAIHHHDKVQLLHLKYSALTIEAVRLEQWVKKGMEVSDSHILI